MATGRRCVPPSNVMIWLVMRWCTGSWRDSSRTAESSATAWVWTRWFRSNLLRSGTKHSMTNIPPGPSTRDVAETLRLPVLAEQAEQRVEDQVHQAERPGGGDLSHVPDHDRDRRAARLGPQPRHHRLGGVDPLHRDPPGGQRERDPAGADRQFQRAVVSG